ncbi:MAG: SpoIIE family protein phosphatase [Clostridia bacterium]|nr:SpoIIE family protein phosphatase [Clostridia bacterium]
MAEMVVRQRKRRQDRWMHAPRRTLTPAQVKAIAGFAAEAAPGFLLSFADVLSIPSGLYAAYIAALAAHDARTRPPLAGCIAALLMRLMWGLPPRWEMLITLGVLIFAPMVVYGRQTAVLMGFTALAALPTAIVYCLQNTAAELMLGVASVALAALAAPVMYRAVKAVTGTRAIDSMEERVSVGFLAAMLLCGGARMLLLVNVGVTLSALGVLLMTMFLSMGAGCVAGMLAGVVLAMQGLPLSLAVALPMGGFLAGVSQVLGKRWVTCAFFGVGSLMALILSRASGMGCALSVVAAAAAVAVTPRRTLERAQIFLRRFLTSQAAAGDAYAAHALGAWEKTVAAMARAVPSPVEAEEDRTPAWWEARLCDGCPDLERCGCMQSELAVKKAEAVWAARDAGDAQWQDALEELRGLGCDRLYHLRASMDILREEARQQQRIIRRGLDQRDMLVTHLTAMSGAARRFAMLSSGESWWDDMSARRIRKVLSELALPVHLSYVRRLQGHIQAAFELEYITGARRQAEELAGLMEKVLDAPLMVKTVDEDRILLCERPLMQLEAAMAAEGITGSNVCGDTAHLGTLQDGRYLAALSDGMGHGDKAAFESRQTVELLRLCLEAGYTRAQTLTAVNGMMLLAGRGERFSTVDMVTIDLWSGQAALDKMGAAGSWLLQQGKLTHLTGDALPIGILEHAESRENLVRLSSGDVLILLTDGVEDAFRSKAALEEAIRAALQEETAADCASAILQSALAADRHQRRDDQTAVVLRVV